MGKADIKIPTCLTGIVIVLPPFDICMDKATHQLITGMPVVIRLKGSNKAAEAALKKYANTNTVVTVCGYWVFSGECSYLHVYYVGPVDEVGEKIHAALS